MSDPTLADLLNVEDEDDEMSFLLTQLASIGFPTTAWQSGGRTYTSLRAFARGLADFSSSIAAFVKGSLLGLSTGDWLTGLAHEEFSLDRFLATFTQGTIAISVAAGAGPYTITANQLIVVEALTHLRFLSTNTTSVTLPAGPSTTTITFGAEHPGAAYNVPIGSGTTLATPLPGVTAAFVDAGLGTWITQQGSDDELDATLQTRCRTRWATIGLQKVDDAYVFLAMNTPGVGTKPTKVLVDSSNPRGPGTTDIWLAAGSGPLPLADVAIVSAYLISLASPAAQDGMVVDNADALNITITATVYYKNGYLTALGDAETALDKLINEVPIGGLIQMDKVIEAIGNTPGVTRVPISLVKINGVALLDKQLLPHEVAVFFSFAVTGIVV